MTDTITSHIKITSTGIEQHMNNISVEEYVSFTHNYYICYASCTHKSVRMQLGKLHDKYVVKEDNTVYTYTEPVAAVEHYKRKLTE